MSRFPLATVLLAAAIAIVAPSSHAALIHFVTHLDGPSEFPPNASPGSGLAAVDIDTVAHSMTVHAEFSGLIGTTTASHIHCCVDPSAAVPTAGVATAVPTFPGFPLGVTSGIYDMTFDLTLAASFNPAFIAAHGGTPASAEADLVAAMLAGDTYLNIHSTEFQGGEIRGFLAVPEPGVVALLALALGAAIGARRRRRS